VFVKVNTSSAGASGGGDWAVNFPGGVRDAKAARDARCEGEILVSGDAEPVWHVARGAEKGRSKRVAAQSWSTDCTGVRASAGDARGGNSVE